MFFTLDFIIAPSEFRGKKVPFYSAVDAKATPLVMVRIFIVRCISHTVQ